MAWRLTVTQLLPPWEGSDVQTLHQDPYPQLFPDPWAAWLVACARIAGDETAVDCLIHNAVTGEQWDQPRVVERRTGARPACEREEMRR